MIQLTSFQGQNSTVRKYTYRVGISAVNAGPVGFTVGSYITDAKRAYYGYSAATCKPVGIGVKLVSMYSEFLVGSAMNVPVMITLAYSNTNFSDLGNDFGGSTTTALLAVCQHGSTPISQSAQNQEEVFLTVVTPVNYTTAAFTWQCVNINTGATINNADLITMVWEISEYVSLQ